MQRKPSKSTRGTNAAEKRWAGMVKAMPCCICNRDAPSIADHVLGSSAKIKHSYATVLVGPWVLLPLCAECDSVKTNGSHRAFVNTFGQHQIEYFLELSEHYTNIIPSDVIEAVRSKKFA